MSLFLKARDWAFIYHEDQLYGNHPYVKHLQDVVGVLWEFGHHHDHMMAAGWLHDILEDTSCPKELLFYEFGSQVGQLVYAVTDGEADTRKERKKIMYQKVQQLPGASILKLADRIANVRAAVSERKHKIYHMYRREMKDFREQIPRLTVAEPMWQELEKLFEPREIA